MFRSIISGYYLASEVNTSDSDFPITEETPEHQQDPTLQQVASVENSSTASDNASNHSPRASDWASGSASIPTTAVSSISKADFTIAIVSIGMSQKGDQDSLASSSAEHTLGRSKEEEILGSLLGAFTTQTNEPKRSLYNATTSDDNCSDWEDVDEDADVKLVFGRIDCRPSFRSYRSLITSMLQLDDRAHAHAPEATSTNAASMPILQDRHMLTPCSQPLAASSTSDDGGPLKSSSKIVRCGILSPRSTRRKMLASEFASSLRQDPLCECKQRPKSNHAVLVRRHTARDISSLRQCPGEGICVEGDDDYKSDWATYEPDDYHSRGW